MTVYGPCGSIPNSELPDWRRRLVGRVIRSWLGDYETAEDAEAEGGSVYVFIVDYVRPSNRSWERSAYFSIMGRRRDGDLTHIDTDLSRWEIADD